MVINYVRSTLRVIQHGKLWAAVNIVCLAVGIAGALAIVVLVQREFGFESYNENSDSLYRVCFNGVMNDNAVTLATTMGPLGPALEREFPGIAGSTRIVRTIGVSTIRIGDREFREEGLFYSKYKSWH